MNDFDNYSEMSMDLEGKAREEPAKPSEHSENDWNVSPKKQTSMYKSENEWQAEDHDTADKLGQ